MQESNYFSAFTGKYIFNNSGSGSGDPFKSYEAYRLIHERGTGNTGGGGNNKGGSAWIAGIIIVILFFIGGWLVSKTDNKFLAAAILITVLALIFLISFMLIKNLENNKIKADKIAEPIEDADPAKKEKSTKIKKVLSNKKGSIESAQSHTLICKDIRIWRAAIKEKSQKQNSEQPIWENGRLLDFIEIAGTHYRFSDEVLNEMIHENDKLDLCREHENTHDPNAVAVYTQSGEHIGYVPQKRNPLVSALMDGGSELFAKVYAKCVFEEKLHVAIEIYIKD